MSGSAEQRVREFEAFVTSRADGQTRQRVWDRIDRQASVAQIKIRRSLARKLAKQPVRTSIAAVAMLLTLAGGTWALLYDPPLLRDDFDNNWLDNSKWRSARPRVKEQDGVLWLRNRGCVVTRKEFPDPISITFRWQWVDLAEDPAYAEVLTIALQTPGETREQYPFEIDDGLLLSFDTQEGAAYLSRATEGQIHKTRLASSGTVEIPLPAHEWHDIRIIDDGFSITLYMKGETIGDSRWENPVFSVPYDARLSGKRIAIYNREVVGGAPHLSQIDDFEVRQFFGEAESGNEFAE